MVLTQGEPLMRACRVEGRVRVGAELKNEESCSPKRCFAAVPRTRWRRCCEDKFVTLVWVELRVIEMVRSSCGVDKTSQLKRDGGVLLDSLSTSFTKALNIKFKIFLLVRQIYHCLYLFCIDSL